MSWSKRTEHLEDKYTNPVRGKPSVMPHKQRENRWMVTWGPYPVCGKGFRTLYEVEEYLEGEFQDAMSQVGKFPVEI